MLNRLLFIVTLFLTLLPTAQAQTKCDCQSTREVHRPNVADATLARWAAEQLLLLNDYNYKNLQQHDQSTRKLFTRNGWRAFNAMRTQMGTVPLVTQKQLQVSSIPNGTIKVTRRGLNRKRQFSWQVDVPLLVRYHSSARELLQQLNVTLLISRTIDNKYGLLIDNYYVVDKQTPNAYAPTTWQRVKSMVGWGRLPVPPADWSLDISSPQAAIVKNCRCLPAVLPTRAHMTDQQLLLWLHQAMQASFNLPPLNLEKRFESIKPFFHATCLGRFSSVV